jgi:antitoxin ParD1/3/4
MGTTRKTITVPEQQDQWSKAQIERGRFTNDSEDLRDLIRRDQDSAKFQTLKEAVQEGWNSGVSDRTVPQIMEGIETRLRAKGRL